MFSRQGNVGTTKGKVVVPLSSLDYNSTMLLSTSKLSMNGDGLNKEEPRQRSLEEGSNETSKET